MHKRKVTRRIGWMLLCLVSILSSCQKTYSPLEYYNLVQLKEGLYYSHVEEGDITYSIQFLPSSFIALLHLKGEVVTQASYENALSSVPENQLVFNVKLNAKDQSVSTIKYGLTQDQDYYDRLSYYSTQFKRDIILLDGTDTLKCALHHFERTFDVSPELTVQCHFDWPGHRPTGPIVINDPIYSNKPIQIPLPRPVGERKPRIKTN